MCPLQLIKDPWIRARLPIKSDHQIKKDMISLIKRYRMLKKNRKRSNAKDLKNRNEFVTEINKVFYIGVNDLESVVKNDKDRTEEMKKHDLAFHYDQER